MSSIPPTPTAIEAEGTDGHKTREPATQPPRLNSRRGGLYTDSTDALKAVHADYLYWTGRLTDSSFQLALGLIAANWAVFGSVERILHNRWSKVSLALVIVSLGLNLLGAFWMSYLHRQRVMYAADNPDGWDKECLTALKTSTAWPFTRAIDVSGAMLRHVKTWLPLLSGLAFLVALFNI